MEEDEQTVVSEEDRETGNVEVTDTLRESLTRIFSYSEYLKGRGIEDIEVIFED